MTPATHLEQNARVSNEFNGYWVPRIGDRATNELRRSSLILMVVAPLMLVLAIVASFTLVSGNIAVVAIGVISVIGIVSAFAYWLRSRIALANAIGDHLGAHVSWAELPRMRGDSFDRWSQMKQAGIRPRSGIHRM